MFVTFGEIDFLQNVGLGGEKRGGGGCNLGYLHWYM